MTFIALDTDLEDDPKLHTLIRVRGWSSERCLAFMFRFWRAVRRHAPDGDVTEWTDGYLATQTRMGRAPGLIDDLINAGLLLKDGDRLIVDGWHQLNGKHIRSNLSKEQKRAGGVRRASSAPRNELGRYVNPGVNPGGTPGVPPGDGPGVPPGSAGPAHPGEPEPEPEPEPKTDSPEPSASGPPHTVFDTVGRLRRFPLYDADVAELGRPYPGVSVTDELRKMAAWLKANPTRRKTASGMPRFINAWLSRAQNSSPGKSEPELSPAERRRSAKEVAAKRARELEESRTPLDVDEGQREKFAKALRLHGLATGTEAETKGGAGCDAPVAAATGDGAGGAS